MKANLETNWSLVYDNFQPQKEGVREALCTLGNGYFATRGAGCEVKADDVHYPGTYLAGGYNRLETEIAGRVIENEDLVNMPNWLLITFRIDNSEWFNLKAVEILSFRQELNIKEGTLSRHIQFKDAHGRTSLLTEKRFVHMGKPHLAGIKWTLTALDWEGTVEISSALDGNIKNYGVKRYRELSHIHLEPLENKVSEDGILILKVRTNQSDIRIAQAAKNKIIYEGDVIKAEKNFEIHPGYVAQHFFINIEKNKTVELQKIVSFFTSRDQTIVEPLEDAYETIKNSSDFDHLIISHINTWESIWHRFGIDIELETKNFTHHPVLILRLHLFHLIQTVSSNILDLDVGVPARGLHGEAYRGHIFWDELFIFPTLNFRMPEITQALIKYRYRRLDAARILAKNEGYHGAMFPWQSGSSGREESQQMHLNPKSGRWIPDHSNIQRHVNVAIVYNVWRYFQATGNFEFLYFYGAELIFEITRFWASITTYNEEIDRFEIKGVMGPDEYHEAYPNSNKPGINNNAYTNIMVVWVCMRALELMEILPENYRKELCKILQIKNEEINLWRDISEKMRICFHNNGIISQFEGYENLKEFDWEGYRKKYGDIQRLDRILEAESDSPNNYKLSKQADLVMLFYLFSSEELKEIFQRLDYPFEDDLITKNIEYYLQRTSHGSTLSRVVHAWVIMRSHREESWNLFLDALKSDVDDIQGGTTAEGVHLGALAGTVDIIQRCYTGMETRDEVLWFKPELPKVVSYLHLRIYYRGHSIEIELTQEKLIISIQKSLAKPIHIGFNNEVYEMIAGDHRIFSLREKVKTS